MIRPMALAGLVLLAGLCACKEPPEFGPVRISRFEPASPANENHPVIQGSAPKGSTVHLFRGAGCQGEPIASASITTWDFAIQVTVDDDSSNTFSALAAKKEDGREQSACSKESEPYVEDSHTPRPVLAAPASPTNKDSVGLSGTTEPGAEVTIFRGPDCTSLIKIVKADAAGEFYASSLTLSPGENHFQVQARDKAGNVSECSEAITIVSDRTAPSVKSAKASDGLQEADVDWWLSGSMVSVRWSGFQDEGGIVSYELAASASANCSSPSKSATFPGDASEGTLTGLAMGDGKRYYSCVRAFDRAGNVSAWVASNGFTVDLTPPSIVSTIPAADAREVNAYLPLQVVFSELMEPDSLTASFTLTTGGGAVAGSFSLQSKTLTFTPSQRLTEGAVYTATLSSGAKDRAGNPLPEHTWSFTVNPAWRPIRSLKIINHTAELSVVMDESSHIHSFYKEEAQLVAQPRRPDGSLSNPVTLTSSASTQVRQAAGAAPDGTTLALWTEAGRLRSRRYTRSGGWGLAEEVNTGLVDPAAEAAVTVDGSGAGTALWVQSDGTRNNLWASRHVFGKWGTPELVERDDAGNVSAPAAAVDGQGNVVGVWVQSNGVRKVLMASRYEAGSGWSLPVPLESGSGDVREPVVAAQANGGATVVWLQADGARDNVWGATYTPGAGWSAAQLLENELGDVRRPSLATDGQGNSIAAWTQSLEGVARIVAARHTLEGGWEPAVALSDARLQTDDPSVGMDAQGRAFVVYTHEAGAGYNPGIGFNRYTPGTGWAAPGFLFNHPLGIFYRPRVVVNARGDAAVLYLGWNSFAYEVLLQTYQ